MNGLGQGFQWSRACVFFLDLEIEGVDRATALDGLRSTVNNHRTNYWYKLQFVQRRRDVGGRGSLGLHFNPKDKAHSRQRSL
ncbi:hypothetical protein TNIN_412161 [Trichonephila inaurata madagascariensis]|uniref:Uncharacterized protein n=1 Tax=Trichonephila inaurata madagascariensis TaxID=2747483 RepID=A0A8X6JS16_9ARAC|nr:hypothetical protein TNIN_412161 [Trichonephila inaurata madagascariensis]